MADELQTDAAAPADIALSIRAVSKVFPGTRALQAVSLDVRYGEVHAICGGNGSGKSTLIKILCGFQQADSGSIVMAGQEVDATGIVAKVAHELGIRVVHQDPAIFPDLSVAENLMLGAEYPRRLGRVQWRAVRREAEALLTEYDIPADPETLLRDLPIGTRTQIAIARALRDVRGDRTVIILDEPTAALPVHEVKALLASMRQLAAKGHAIVFVSHRLDEVLSATDRVTVMRDGRVYREHLTSKLTEDELIESILGRRANEVRAQRQPSVAGDATVSVSGLCAGPLRDVSLEVRAGEVVGIAGLLGAGRSELLRAIYGELPRTAGTVLLRGQRADFKRPDQAIAAGVVLVPEDRALGAIFADKTVDENINLSVLPEYWRRFWFSKAGLNRDAAALRAKFRVKAPSGQVAMRALSGGNQQKAVLARWLRRQPLLLLLDEPTQGVDVGARADIYGFVREVTAAGGAAIVVTSDLEELAQFVDRAIVLRNGRCVAEVGFEELSAHRLNQLLHVRAQGR